MQVKQIQNIAKINFNPSKWRLAHQFQSQQTKCSCTEKELNHHAKAKYTRVLGSKNYTRMAILHAQVNSMQQHTYREQRHPQIAAATQLPNHSTPKTAASDSIANSKKCSNNQSTGISAISYSHNLTCCNIMQFISAQP